MSEAAKKFAISDFIRSRGAVFAEIFTADAQTPDRLLDILLAEEDADIRLPIARLLRPAADRLKSRLLELARGGQPERSRQIALAALGSPRDADSHAILDAVARLDPAEPFRLLAVESIGSIPEHYRMWNGLPAAEVTLKAVIENDSSPAVRTEAARALVALLGRSPEVSTYLHERASSLPTMPLAPSPAGTPAERSKGPRK